MKNISNNGEQAMETLIRTEQTATGFAHWIRLASGLVVIEFVGGN